MDDRDGLIGQVDFEELDGGSAQDPVPLEGRARNGFLRGLAQAAGFQYRENQTSEKDRYIHAAGILVVNPEGTIARYFYGFDYPPRDLRLAVVEASDNRIGSAIDQLLLLCYRYDPSQGKYTLAILSILRLSGVMTILALGTFLTVQFRREYRKKPAKEENR
jgi:protein SCO1